MYLVYILYSASLDRFYTGISEFKVKRQRQHMRGHTYWTSRANDWSQVWATDIAYMAEARALEKRIKARGARRFLKGQGVAVPPDPLP